MAGSAAARLDFSRISALVFSILSRSCTAICGAVPQVSEEEEQRMQILISGGANSGKSSLAEQLAVAQSFQPRYYFATMQVWDAECARRIERHRQQRAGKDFQTVEVPTNLLETISTLPQGGCGLLELSLIHI